jgi:hypothetical protein
MFIMNQNQISVWKKNIFSPKISIIMRLMCGSSHIHSVLIGVEFWMFIYFLLFCLGKLNQN